MICLNSVGNLIQSEVGKGKKERLLTGHALTAPGVYISLLNLVNLINIINKVRILILDTEHDLMFLVKYTNMFTEPTEYDPTFW